ncbi:MAG: M15 family metallopeptidase [Spirochaetaceae bacterium]
MSSSEFNEIVSTLPIEIRTRALRNPTRFLDLTAAVLDSDIELLRHVDRSHGLEPDDEPAGMVGLRTFADSISVSAPDDRLVERAALALRDMTDAARLDDVNLDVSSVYRDYETQEELYANHLERFGYRLTSQLVAPPGHSEHQLGTTVDFFPVGRNFDGTPQDLWLRAHAADYGFSLSYPSGLEDVTGYLYESWHYRYIGSDAVAMKDSFFRGVQYYLTRFFDEHGPFLAQVYRR